MPHSFRQIWIHAIWATKHRMPMIHKGMEQSLYSFMTEQFQLQGCPVKIIYGMPDHIHCLFVMNPNKSISSIIKHIKGSSSYFINHNNLTNEQFQWQNGYAAFSVSASMVDQAHQYILRQKEHHKKKMLQIEYEEFLKNYENQENQDSQLTQP